MLVVGIAGCSAKAAAEIGAVIHFAVGKLRTGVPSIEIPVSDFDGFSAVNSDIGCKMIEPVAVPGSAQHWDYRTVPIICIQHGSEIDLAHLIDAANGFCITRAFPNAGNKIAGQNGNDGDHDQQLNQSEEHTSKWSDGSVFMASVPQL